MEAVSIILAISVLVLSIILTVGGARLIDLAEKYIHAEDERRRFLVENASYKEQQEADADAIKRLNGLVTDINRKLASARADAVNKLDDAALTAALNDGVVRSDQDGLRRSSHRDTGTEDTAPNRTSAGKTDASSARVPK